VFKLQITRLGDTTVPHSLGKESAEHFT